MVNLDQYGEWVGDICTEDGVRVLVFSLGNKFVVIVRSVWFARYIHKLPSVYDAIISFSGHTKCRPRGFHLLRSCFMPGNEICQTAVSFSSLQNILKLILPQAIHCYRNQAI